MQYNYSNNLFTERAEPIRINAFRDNQISDKCGYVVVLWLCGCTVIMWLYCSYVVIL